ncbi:MAG: Holliday junction resolvase RuvX [Clostridia bacterium]|nr:Holliday junction resolvase RuvX [Clostridia bacterium]
MRVCALDLGDSRTGVAFSDLLMTLVGETLVIHEKNTAKLMDKICALLAEKKPGAVAVGCPVNMDGTRGERAQRAQRLAEELAQRTGLRVDLVDERRTTVDAHRILSDNGVFGKKRKDTVDAVAASLILETYMGILKREGEKK